MGENNEGIEVKITSQIERTANQVKLLTKSLEEAGYKLKNFKTNADSMGNTLITLANDNTTLKMKMDIAGNAVGEWTSKTKEATEVAKQASNATKSFKNTLGTAVNLGKFYLLWNLTKRIRDTLKDCVTQSIDFTETTNKFVVSMGSASKEATRFQNKLSEAFGTNRNEMMDFQSTFKNIMSSSAELSSQTAEKISESLTQMGLDYSSLFNTSQKSAMEKIQSALVGSIRPIRADSGYDISNKALVSTAQSLGVDKTSSQLTEMEKRLLRIITLMNQMKNTGAMQDLARTIESPANQIKVLNNQLQELKIALGNVFMGTIGQILPYINGFVMALRAVISALSVFFGWASGDNGGLEEAFEVANDGASGIASSLGAGAKSAKEIKKQLMGFDVLNVINTNKDKSGGSGGGAGVGTVDPKILNALKDYDSLMSKVRMKAIDIRDAIMKWLGFVKKINPETGKIEWALKKGYTNLQMIGTILKVIAGLFIAKKAIQLYGALRNIATLLGGGTPTLKAFQSGLQGIGIAFKDGSANAVALEKGASNLLTTFGKFALGLGGSIIAIKGFVDLAKQSSELMETGTTDATKYFGSLVEIAGGFTMLGASIGGVKGAIAGGVIGLVVSLGTALYNLGSEQRQTNKEIENSTKQWEKYKKSVQDKLNTDLTQLDYTKKLSKELHNLVDSNGQVKAGYEDRVKFILGQFNDALGTEYQLTDGIITQNGERINSEKELQNTIKKTIEIKKAEAIASANQELYTKALQEQTKFFKERQKAQEQALAAENEFKQALEENGLTLDDYTNKTRYYNFALANMEDGQRSYFRTVRDSYEEQKEVLNSAEQNWKEATDSIIKYENLKEAIISEDSEKIQKASSDLVNSYKQDGISMTLSLAEQIQKESAIRDEHVKLIKEKGQEISDDMREQLNYQVNLVSDTLVEQSKTLETLTPDVVKGWKALAESSKDIYDEKIKQVNPATKLAIESVIGQVNLNDDNVIRAWKKLAIGSENEYNRVLGNMPEDTRKQIEAITGKTSNLSYKVNQQFAELGRTGANAFSSNFKSFLNIGKIHIGVNTESGRLEIKKYWTGGLPDTGELFMARERGPELVGKIGNSSAVVNNQQIVQAVSQGVAEAVSSVMGNVGGGSYNFYIDGRQITDVVQERINRNMNIAGA